MDVLKLVINRLTPYAKLFGKYYRLGGDWIRRRLQHDGYIRYGRAIARDCRYRSSDTNCNASKTTFLVSVPSIVFCARSAALVAVLLAVFTPTLSFAFDNTSDPSPHYRTLQQYPSPDEQRYIAYRPSSDEIVYSMTLNTCLWSSIATSSFPVRVFIYDGSLNMDDPTLLGYSDWFDVNVVTGGSNCSYASLEQNEVTVTFGSGIQLNADTGYLLGVQYRYGAIPYTSSALQVAVSEDTAYYDENQWFGYWGNDVDDTTTPWTLGTFNSIYVASSSLFASTNATPTDETSISITSIATYEVATSSLVTNYSCTHNSWTYSAYGSCYFASSADAVLVNFDYNLTDADVYSVEGWLLDEDRHVLFDDFALYRKVQSFATSSGSGQFVFNLLPYGSVDQALLVARVCADPADIIQDGDVYTVECATVAFGIGYPNEADWLDVFYDWTVNNDGVEAPIEGFQDEDDEQFWNTFVKSPLKAALLWTAEKICLVPPWSAVCVVTDAYYGTYATSTASSSVAELSTTTSFYISYDPSRFGINATSTYISFAGIGPATRDLSPDLFDAVDTFLWGLFGVFLVFRVVTGVWQGGLMQAESSAERIVDRTGRDAARYARGFSAGYYKYPDKK